jgi:hypothetical protein
MSDVERSMGNGDKDNDSHTREIRMNHIRKVPRKNSPRLALQESLRQVADLSALVRGADTSRWLRSSNGVINVSELSKDPSWTATRDIEGMTTTLLMAFEGVLSNASDLRDLSRLLACADGYYSDGALSDGVIDDGVAAGLVTVQEAGVLREKTGRSPRSVMQIADHVDDKLAAVRSVLARIDAQGPAR